MTNGAEVGEETAPEEGQRHEPERALACNPSTSGFTGKPALVLDRPGGIPQGYGLTSRRSVTEPRWVSSPPSYCATAPLRTDDYNSKVLSERGGAGQRVGYTKTGPRASPNRITPESPPI